MISRHFYDGQSVWNVTLSMDSLRIVCVAVAIALSTASCIEWRTAERRPHPPTVPERPDAAPAGGEAVGGAGSVALLGTPGARSPSRPGSSRAPSMADDTWERVREMMTVVPVQREVSSLREFRRKMRRYHGNQRFFDAMGRNAQPWLYHVTRKLAARGVPGEVALLPAVESGYDPRAVSSRNAAGLWQILPGTARELKLARSWWYDARHDAPAATEAALDYLSLLRDEFDGDWMLAVAAYNCGPGNVRRAIRRAGRTIETADYAAIERYLPNETRGHMARWLVLSEMVALPRLHNVEVKPIPWRPYFTEVATTSQVELATVARYAGVATAEIAGLNLGFRRGMTAPNGPHRLLVPTEHAHRVARELSRARPVQRTAERRRYRIRKGDTLGVIAQAHNISVKTLMAANRLDSHIIRAGRDLMIPIPGSRPVVGSPTADADVHVVSRGESLWHIARQYRTTVRSLRDWNRLAPGSNLLHPGQQLRVRGEG